MLNTKVETVEKITEIIKSKLQQAKNKGQKNASVASLFKFAKQHHSCTTIGDFILLGMVIDQTKAAGFKVSRGLIKKSIDLSDMKDSPIEEMKEIIIALDFEV